MVEFQNESIQGPPRLTVNKIFSKANIYCKFRVYCETQRNVLFNNKINIENKMN